MKHLIRQQWRYLLQNKSIRTLLMGGLGIFSYKVLGSLMGFALAYYAAMYAGTEALGLYYISIGVATLLFVLSTSGFRFLFLKYIPAYKQSLQLRNIYQLYIKASKHVFLVSSVLSALLFFLAPLLAKRVFENPNLEICFQVIAIGLPFIAHMLCHVDFFRALKRFHQSEYLQWLHTPLLTLILFAIISTFDFSVYNLVISYISARFIGWIISLLLALNPLKKFKNSQSSVEVIPGALWKMYTPVSIAALANFLMGSTNILMLGVLGTESDVAVFTVAMNFTMLIYYLSEAVNTYLYPLISENFHNKDRTYLKKLLLSSAVIRLLLTLPLIALFLAFPSFLMGIFGDQFLNGNYVLTLLTFAMVLAVLEGPTGYILNISGNQNIVTAILTVTVCLNIALNYTFIGQWGINGAAIATLISFFCYKLTLVIVAFRKTQLNTSIFRITF